MVDALGAVAGGAGPGRREHTGAGGPSTHGAGAHGRPSEHEGTAAAET
ncbi:hypothetical protein FF36_05744 [Frankia torreyi]|uniref:Uncharacterized protein n=1 Tax=Frankia torreyi TaxID=1856 RepID=A0A0D8B726_9ACTN|nr:hypothetical protein [Frankia sp. ACN1ag]KJE19981.1 hypothetical protein FF36_05744 [Frankia torreyi]KQM02485.1 hypothetical protein FF86_10659 [Frankia sp. CpI1-P]